MTNDDIKVFGLFGFPISHSLSPAMHDAALRALRIPGIYFAFERTPKEFLRLLRSKKKMVLDGFNVTIPHKETVVPYMDWLDRPARVAGAVNTVHRAGNRWKGYNTDIDGFLAGLRQARFHPRAKKAVILGAGGAARAVLVALALSGVARVSVYDVACLKALKLTREFKKKFSRLQLSALSDQAELKQELREADLLVNATGVGLRKHDPAPVPASFLTKKRMLVYDLIYSLKYPSLLRLAKRLGHRVVNGETMLLGQGARAFEIWTGKKAPVKVMRKALRDGTIAA